MTIRISPWLAVITAACWTSPVPPAPARAPSAPARDPIDAACERLLAANRRKDDVARAAIVAEQRRGDFPVDWAIGEPWSGECARTPAGAWGVRLDSVIYGGVHAVTWTMVRIGRHGAVTPATNDVGFNYVSFRFRDVSDDAVTVSYVSEGPEEDHQVAVRYVWDGSVRQVPSE